MDGPRQHYTLWSKSDKDKYYISQILCNITIWNLKNNTNESIYRTENRFTDIENKLMVTKGESRGGGRDKLGVI